MSNQFSGRQSDSRPRSSDQNDSEQLRQKVSGAETRSQITEGIESTTNTAKRAASEAASTIGSHMKELLDNQLGSGADIIGQLGSSAQRAAEDLEQNAPQLAGLVRGVADRMEGYAEDLRDQSVDELFRSASNFHASPASSRIWTCCARRLFCTAHAQEHFASAPVVARTRAVSLRASTMAHEQLRSSTIVRALADVVGDFTDLLQKEVQLARAELSANLSAKLQGGVWIGMAAALTGLARSSLPASACLRAGELRRRPSLVFSDCKRRHCNTSRASFLYRTC